MNQSTSETWEDAAEEAVTSLFDRTFSNGLEEPNQLIRYMRHKIQSTLKENGEGDYDYIYMANVAEQSGFWQFMASHAIRILRSTGTTFTAQEMLNILAMKQQDYGPNNIAEFGIVGLLIRVNDKIARLEHITQKTDSFNAAININAVAAETLLDTIIDIIGYSAIATMWLAKDQLGSRKFLLPMRSTRPTQPTRPTPPMRPMQTAGTTWNNA